MDRDDLLLSVERHATSKLADDGLDDIRTLGFRGEALASIGAVARAERSRRGRRMRRRGLRLEVDRSRKAGAAAAGDEPRHDRRGARAVRRRAGAAQIPEVRSGRSGGDHRRGAAAGDGQSARCISSLDGADRSPINWPGERRRCARRGVMQVMGADFAENAVPLATARHGVVVTGLAGLPTYSRANSLSQFYFVNGRSVRDKVLLGAVRAAYADFVFRDRFPAIALFLSVDPAAVDVNVHPAKAELRFRDAGGVRSAVIRAIARCAGRGGLPRVERRSPTMCMAAFRAPEMAEAAGRAAPPPPASRGPPPRAARERNRLASLAGFAEPSARFEAFEAAADDASYPLGTARAQMFENFIVAQNGDCLVLVDQHAAHERLVYERFKAQLASGPVASQMQLIPVVIELPEEDCARLEEAAPTLERLGLYLERFGPRAVAVRETPALLGQADVDGLVRDLADGLAEWDSAEALGDRLDAIIAPHGLPRLGALGPRAAGRRDECAAARDGAHAAFGPVHPRPADLCRAQESAIIERMFGRTRLTAQTLRAIR